MTRFDRDTERGYFSHPSAEIEPGAEIGEGTKIWHQAQVRAGATVGRDCVLGKNVFVDQGATIGDRVKIQNNVSVYNGVHIEDEAFLGPSAVLTNDLFPRAVSEDWEVVHTYLRTGSSIGANATIICGIEIGEWAMIGAGSVVTKDVAPHSLMLGNPARLMGWVCQCGRVLSKEPEMTATECPNCGRRNGPFP